MISNFFVLSPRGDTIILKQYRSNVASEIHERSHTEAFFRKIKFWEGNGATTDDAPDQHQRTGDAPPVFLMPDGHSYMHIKRNGLIFGASTVRNVSANTVLEVRPIYDDALLITVFCCTCQWVSHSWCVVFVLLFFVATLYHCQNI